MGRNTFRILIVATMLLAIPAFAGRATAHTTESRCPAMTDSIDRLYHAFFQRDPDPNGFAHWVGLYRSGEQSLAEIAQEFSQSPEFTQRGLVSDRTYTLWVYRNLLQREPTADELDYWVRSLSGGYPRGSMMITITESHDYVAATNTVRPLAGYRRWYPKGTHWYCDTGPLATGVNPLVGTVWADYYFYNHSDDDDSIWLWTREDDSTRAVTMVERTLGPGASDYNWDGDFRGDGDYGRQIEVQVGSRTDWIVVFYPYSIGPERLGWQITG